MAVLDDLPDEILLYVLEQAAQGERPADKLPLLKVNKRFSRLAEPLLYRVISAGNTGEEGSGSALQTKQLIATILTGPRKAAHVQNYLITNTDSNSLDDQDEPLYELEFLGHAVRDKVEAIIDHAFKDDEDMHQEWSTDKEGCDNSFWAALLIVQMPNLQVLDAQGFCENLWTRLDELVPALTKYERGQGRPGPLQSLQSVTFGSHAPEFPDSTDPLVSIANMPHVRYLRGIAIGDGDEGTGMGSETEEHEHFLQMEPKSTDLVRIEFRPNCKLEAERLTHFLSTPKALKSFDYHIGHMSAWVQFRTSDLMEALLQQKDSLEDVTIHKWELLNDFNDDLDWEPLDFSAFTALTRLSLDVSFIYGSDNYQAERVQTPVDVAKGHALKLVPPTIESLAIVMCDSEDPVDATIAVFEKLLENRDSMFPKLHTLEIGATEDNVYSCVEQLESARVLGEGMGVTLKVYQTEADDEVGVRIVEYDPTLHSEDDGVDAEDIDDVDEADD